MLLLILVCTVLVAPLAASAENVVTSYLVDKPGVACLDGTPQRYWLRSSKGGQNSTKWVIHMMGGGWCMSVESCTSRGLSQHCYIGSSNTSCFLENPGNMLPGNESAYRPQMPLTAIPSVLGARWQGGLGINNASTNPLAHDWNFAEVSYCSGGSYAGNNASLTRVSYNGEERDLYFRGGVNLNAVLDDLIENHGLGDATRMVVTGDSAGGLATYWHTDGIAKKLPHALTVGIPDSGFFFAVPEDDPSWPVRLQWVGDYMNETAYLQQDCVAEALARKEDVGKACTLPELVAPHIRSPIFAFNSRYDPAMLGISAGNPKDPAEINRVGQKLLEAVNATVVAPSPINAAFISACHEHCGQWSQFQELGPNGQFNDFFVRTPDGVTLPVAFNGWFAAVEALFEGWRAARPDGEHAFDSMRAWREHLDRDNAAADAVAAAMGRRWFEQPAKFPCNSCCAGGNS